MVHDRGVASLRRATAFTLLLLLGACSKDSPSPVDPGGGGGGGGGTGGSVADSLRTVVLDSLDSRIAALPGVNPAADNQTMLAYIRTRSEFEASGILAGSVWARFKDGRVYVFVNNFFGTDADSVVYPSAPKATRRDPPRGPLLFDENLPEGSGARIMNSLGPHFDRTGPDEPHYSRARTDIQGWLQEAGYTNLQTDPTVDQLKGVAHDGVVYWTAHGAYGVARNNDTLFGVWTSTDRQVLGGWSSDTLYTNDLNDGSMFYFSAAHDNGLLRPRSRTRYAITHKFVTKHMSFGRNCVVFVNACGSDDQEFRAAVLSKNAGLYLGWDNTINAKTACRIGRFFYDRALGANAEAPIMSPPQKGYQTYDAWGFMYTVGLAQTVIDRGNGPIYAQLNYNPMLANVTMLRPLIYYVAASEVETRVVGWFGVNPGAGQASVTLGGVDVPIQSWLGATTIVCDPVRDGGEVVVTVRGRKSKPAPLTKFRGTFQYTLTGRGSLQKRVTVGIDFLAYVRTNRVSVDEAPSWGVPTRLIYTIPSTSGSYTASGEYRDDQGNLVESWSGGGPLALRPAGSSGTGVSVTGVIDMTAQNHQSHIMVDVSAPYTRNNSTAQLTIQYNVGTLRTQMTSAFVIPGASYPGGSGTESATGSFTNFSPIFPPTSSTPR